MGQTIQVRRGAKANLPTLNNGELALTTDTKDLYVGTPTGNELIGGSSISSQLAENTNLACIVRQDPSTGIWSILNDTGHVPQHVVSVTQDANQIRINYDQTFKKIKSLVAVPDDVLNKTGYQFGGDVGLSYANITIAKPSPIGGYIASNPSNFTLLDTIGFNSANVAWGVNSYPGINTLKITHEKALAPLAPVNATTHGIDTKFDVVPVNVSDTMTEFMLVGRKKKHTLVASATGNVFSIDVGNSDESFGITSWSGGSLRISTPKLIKPGLSIECSGFPVVITARSFFNNNDLQIWFYDANTNTQLTTIPDGFIIRITLHGELEVPANLTTGDIAFYFNRPSLASGKAVNPSTPMPAGNNIWVYGLFEK